MIRNVYAPLATGLCLCAMVVNAQNTVGLVSYDPSLAQDGYMLIYPDQQSTVFLLDACGQVVHAWPDTVFTPGNGVRFMDDGGISRTAVGLGNDFFIAGGAGEFVQRKDWDNNVTWRYRCSSDVECMHHDVEVLPNGNVLIIAWELKTTEEAWAYGRDTVGYGHATVWPEKIIEVQPTGPESGTVVWEWHVWDHLVQGLEPFGPNYGVVAEHPELVDINYYGSGGDPDWLHINAIDHNPGLDQIILSVPFFNELWVIDHSTTTAEAAQHTGGNAGRGGDLLYRWGNPAAYDQGTPEDQQLFFNHCTSWIGPGLPPDDPDVGKILLFNNRAGGNYSAADVITPPLLPNGTYAYVPGEPYGPAVRDQRFTTAVPTDMFSPGQGSAQKLPNGNLLVCSSRQGWMLQLAPDGTVDWSYINPLDNGVPVAQGTEIEDLGIVFQAAWIPSDHPGLQGRDLTPIGYVELEPNLSFCAITTNMEEKQDVHVSLESNLVNSQLVVNTTTAVDYFIADPTGRVVTRGRFAPGRSTLDVQDWPSGTYLMHAAGERAGTLRFVIH